MAKLKSDALTAKGAPLSGCYQPVEEPARKLSGAFDLATGLLGIRKGGYRIIPLVMLLHFFRCTDDYFVANLGV